MTAARWLSRPMPRWSTKSGSPATAAEPAACASRLRVDAGGDAVLQGNLVAATPPARVTLHVAADGLATFIGQASLGDGGITKEGPGVAEFHNLDYTGETIVHAGAVRLIDAPSIAGAFELYVDATLELNGSNTFLSSS